MAGSDVVLYHQHGFDLLEEESACAFTRKGSSSRAIC